MAKLTVEGEGTFDVPDGKRMVLALTDEVGIDQLHACGGKGKCTTCRVKFRSGEPSVMTEAEKTTLAAKNLLGEPGLRLSCQVECWGEMSVQAISRLRDTERPDAGNRPEDIRVTPELGEGGAASSGG